MVFIKFNIYFCSSGFVKATGIDVGDISDNM